MTRTFEPFTVRPSVRRVLRVTASPAAQRTHRDAARSRHGIDSPSHAPAAHFDVARLPLRDVDNVLAMQRSVGNRAVAQYFAPGGSVQRVIERGQGTGWGAIKWVTGGKDLWNRIDQGFNKDLFDIQDELSTLQEKLRGQEAYKEVNAAYQSVSAFIELG